MGATYSRPSVSVLSCAPNIISSSRSKKIISSQITAARMTEPITEAVKYSLDFLSCPCSLPRIVLNITEPPMPINRPKL